MKTTYIVPATKVVVIRPAAMMASSTLSTYDTSAKTSTDDLDGEITETKGNFFGDFAWD